MLIIRAQQMAEFERLAEADFLARLRVALEPELGGAAIESVLKEGVARAGAFGLRRECDVARFLALVYGRYGVTGPGGLPRAALSILTRYGMDPDEKLRRFAEWLDGQPRGAGVGA